VACIIGAQPVDEFLCIRRAEHVVECVVLALSFEALVLGDQMQVVVAEHHHRPVPQLAHEAQHLQRLWPPVDQVADEPEPVVRRIEADAAQQRLQLVKTALHIPYRVGRHGTQFVTSNPNRMPAGRGMLCAWLAASHPGFS
jgi:hypothetical protein